MRRNSHVILVGSVFLVVSCRCRLYPLVIEVTVCHGKSPCFKGDIIYRSEDFPYLLVNIHFLMAKVFVDPSWPGLETHKNAPKLYIDVENLWISGTQMLHKWWINSTLNC
jgi:hypothetical protein